MIVILGIFIIMVGWILDAGTTYIIMAKGYALLESNPIFIKFGLIPFLIFSILTPLILIYGWVWINKLYRKVYKSGKFKLYDIFVFMWCFIIIFVAFNQVMAGWNHINIILEDQEQIERQFNMIEEFAQENPTIYNEKMMERYMNEYSKVNYFVMIFILLCSYFLFRIGYKVKPNDL